MAISDLKGISPLVCTHHIYMEEEAKPIRQPQRRLNPHMQEVVRAEVEATSRIVLGHIISEKGIEVDKAKVELIVKLPSPTTVKGVRQFLGHIGVVLGQREDGKPYVIYYASKTLNEAQRNYTATEKELLAVVFALDKFRAYLVGSFIIVFTDHSALKDKKGVENVVADHLSSEWKAQDRKHFFVKIHAYYWEEPFLFKYYADQIIRKCVLKKSNKESSAIAMRVHVETTLLLENNHEGVAIRV
ncbi:Retrovirus-related Pol polyprotein from transposon opus [Vitis vinifera]|uniref:Retrovirus-related Pol polyprotein from transposon opus n=1 Tax=Vitis vinifera TaxID=29760 RepID=A0A438FE88_VITVI|nr:Retrovirus-related Pol polyprotein from transposon opus [Vitis vinifera]